MKFPTKTRANPSAPSDKKRKSALSSEAEEPPATEAETDKSSKKKKKLEQDTSKPEEKSMGVASAQSQTVATAATWRIKLFHHGSRFEDKIFLL